MPHWLHRLAVMLLARTYEYDPAKIAENGKDRMRFELGDTMTDGGPDTCALTDEEICAALNLYPEKWKRAKLALLESLCRRFSYEVNTTEGPVKLELLGRAKLWRADYEALKKELADAGTTVPSYGMGIDGEPKRPSFWKNMMINMEAESDEKLHVPPSR